VSDLDQLRNDLRWVSAMLLETEEKLSHTNEMLKLALNGMDEYRKQVIELQTRLMLEGPYGPKL
jgi:hypothetical protein